MEMDAGVARMNVHIIQLGELAGNQETRPELLLQKSVVDQSSSSKDPSRPAGSGTMQGKALSQLLAGSSAPTDDTGRPVGSERPVNTIVGSERGACIFVAPLQAAAAGQKESRLKSLQESLPHRMRLEQLMKTEMQIQREKFAHKRNHRRAGKELYQIVSLFALLVSAIFAAVAQTTIFTCEVVWGPVLVTALVAAATWCGVSDKLRCMSQHKQEAHVSAVRQNAVYDVIAEMRMRGAAFNLDLQPQHDLSSPGLARCGSSPFSPRIMLVRLFLVGISVVAITSFYRMLCGLHCNCSPL